MNNFYSNMSSVREIMDLRGIRDSVEGMLLVTIRRGSWVALRESALLSMTKVVEMLRERLVN